MSPACPAGASLAIAWSKSPLGWIVWQVIVATLARPHCERWQFRS
jgi:hypothetical protein